MSVFQEKEKNFEIKDEDFNNNRMSEEVNLFKKDIDKIKRSILRNPSIVSEKKEKSTFNQRSIPKKIPTLITTYDYKVREISWNYQTIKENSPYVEVQNYIIINI